MCAYMCVGVFVCSLKCVYQGIDAQDTRHMVDASAEKTEREISSVATATYTQSDSNIRKLSAVEIKLVYRKQMYYGNKSVY